MKVPRFVPRPPWIGGDLRTLRNFMRPPGDVLARWPGQEMRFAMKDGTGDELHGALHRPAQGRPREPLVLLLHGLTGSQERVRICVSRRVSCWAAGYPVLRLSWRGAGPSTGMTKAFYHAGRSDDLAALLRSMSGYLAENGVDGDRLFDGRECAAEIFGRTWRDLAPARRVAVSPPIDLRAAQQRIATRRNRRYHHICWSG